MGASRLIVVDTVVTGATDPHGARAEGERLAGSAAARPTTSASRRLDLARASVRGACRRGHRRRRGRGLHDRGRDDRSRGRRCLSGGKGDGSSVGGRWCRPEDPRSGKIRPACGWASCADRPAAHLLPRVGETAVLGEGDRASRSFLSHANGRWPRGAARRAAGQCRCRRSSSCPSPSTAPSAGPSRSAPAGRMAERRSRRQAHRPALSGVRSRRDELETGRPPTAMPPLRGPFARRVLRTPPRASPNTAATRPFRQRRWSIRTGYTSGRGIPSS